MFAAAVAASGLLVVLSVGALGVRRAGRMAPAIPSIPIGKQATRLARGWHTL